MFIHNWNQQDVQYLIASGNRFRFTKINLKTEFKQWNNRLSKEANSRQLRERIIKRRRCGKSEWSHSFNRSVMTRFTLGIFYIYHIGLVAPSLGPQHNLWGTYLIKYRVLYENTLNFRDILWAVSVMKLIMFSWKRQITWRRGVDS